MFARHPPGPYQIQAAISALHAQAASAETTDWPQIVALYETLRSYDPSPVVLVNQAVARCFCGEAGSALRALESLRDEDVLPGYQPLYAALAFAFELTGGAAGAADAYRHAIELAASAPQKVYLQSRLSALQIG